MRISCFSAMSPERDVAYLDRLDKLDKMDKLDIRFWIMIKTRFYKPGNANVLSHNRANACK